MMSELNLSHEFLKKIEQILIDNDSEAQDKVTQAQYLSVLMGLVVSDIAAPEDRLSELMEQLCAFSTHVFDEEINKKQPPPPPPQDAFGVWRP